MDGPVIAQYSLLFDSKYRNRGTNAVPIFDLPQTLRLSDPNNQFELELLSAACPFSFHSLYAPENTLQYTLTVPQHGVNNTATITIPPGNYDILTLLSQLEALLAAAMTASGLPVNRQPTLTFTYSRSTMRCTLGLSDVKTGDTFTFRLYWSLADILAPYFGFSFETDTVLSYNTSGVVTSTNFVSPNCVNVSPITSLYLRSDSLMVVTTDFEQLVESVATPSNVLGVVPISTSPVTWVHYESNGFKVRLRDSEVRTLQLYWTSLTYEPTVFDGVAWRVHLMLREIQQQPPQTPLAVKIPSALEQAQAAQLVALQLKQQELASVAQSQMGKMRSRLLRKLSPEVPAPADQEAPAPIE